MATSRTAIVRGPGAVKLGTVVLHDSGGISADIVVTANEARSSIEGLIDQFASSRHAEISLIPAGQISAEILAALYPYQTPTPGTALFGGSDVACIVHSKAGVKATFKSAAVVASPQLRLSHSMSAFAGAVRIRCLLGAGDAPEDSGALITIASEAYSAVTYPHSATILTAAYVGELDGTPIPTQSGWVIDRTYELATYATDAEGEIAVDLVSATTIARCTPVAEAESALLALLPYNLAQGTSARSGSNLVISAGAGSGGISATLYDVAVMQGPMRWGPTALRAGEYAFVAHRTVSGDALGADCAIIMEPAE